MGTFAGHILPGVAFVAVGIWHLFNILRNYVETPWSYQARPWFPTKFSNKHLKRLEPIVTIFGGCLSIALELFICPKAHQPFADDWSIPDVHLNNFEHSTISLFFVIYGVTCLTTDILKLHVPKGWLQMLGVFVLSQELMLFHFHSADHMGLEGHFHWLLQLPIATAIIAILFEIAAPAYMIISLIRAMSIIFQGTWFIQMGLVLYKKSLAPIGCKIMSHDGHSIVVCDTSEATMRAKALANLFFSWHLATILVITMFWYLALLYRHREQQFEYEPMLSNLKNTQGFSSGDEENQQNHQTMTKDVDTGVTLTTSKSWNSHDEGSHDGSHDESHSSESDIEMSSILLER